MMVVTIDKAGTEFFGLVALVEAGEEVVFVRGDRPVAKIVALGR
jgi:antitoxin (DNA-binding transcriptional repressor) of toxin-antitoxin stability system